MVFQDGVEPMFFEGRSYFKGFSFEEAIEQPQGSQSDSVNAWEIYSGFPVPGFSKE